MYVGETLFTPYGPGTYLVPVVLGGRPCRVVVLDGRYATGDLAVVALLQDGQVYAKLSVCVDWIETGGPIDPSEFVLDHDLDEADRAALTASGSLEDTGRRVSYGYVRDRPVLRVPGWPRP